MKSTRLLSIASVLFAVACSPTDHEPLPLGMWKIDSIYTHYNGFNFTRKDVTDEPYVEYLPEGKLKMSKGKESRYFSYEVKTDSLFHYLDHATEKFVINRSDKKHLVLRRDLRPLFKEANQVRYEIRFFSKVEHQ
jgi:hypothetical protein